MCCVSINKKIIFSWSGVPEYFCENKRGLDISFYLYMGGLSTRYEVFDTFPVLIFLAQCAMWISVQRYKDSISTHLYILLLLRFWVWTLVTYSPIIIG